MDIEQDASSAPQLPQPIPETQVFEGPAEKEPPFPDFWMAVALLAVEVAPVNVMFGVTMLSPAICADHVSTGRDAGCAVRTEVKTES